MGTGLPLFGGQRSACGTQSYHFAMWILGVKLRLSGKGLYLLTHLVGPHSVFLVCLSKTECEIWIFISVQRHTDHFYEFGCEASINVPSHFPHLNYTCGLCLQENF